MSDINEQHQAEPKFAAYAAARAEAQAKLIQISMDRRRSSGPPVNCEMEYEVLGR
jgi:hypothetical protein